MTFFEAIPNRVKEESEDRIVLFEDSGPNAFFGLFLSVIGSVFCHATFIGAVDIEGGLLERIGFLILSLAFIVIGIFILFAGLSSREVIIDKIFQIVTIKAYFTTKYFSSVEKISFSRIKSIEVLCCTECTIDHDSLANNPSDSWKIALITIDGGSTPIYCNNDDCTLKIEEIAGKIRKMIYKKLPHQSVNDNKNNRDTSGTPILPTEKS